MAESAKTNITIADKLDMPLDAITKLEKKKRQQERKEAQKAKKAEKSAAGPKKTDSANKKDNKDNKKKEATPNRNEKKRSRADSEKSDKKERTDSAKKSDLPPLTTGTPIIVSNVDPAVNAQELKDIFQEVGAVKDIEILPARKDKPTAARIIFRVKSDAEKAVELFNNRQLDGKTITVRVVPSRVVVGGKKREDTVDKKGDRDEPRNNKRQRKSTN